jgi:hypothetical protein
MTWFCDFVSSEWPANAPSSWQQDDSSVEEPVTEVRFVPEDSDVCMWAGPGKCRAASYVCISWDNRKP